MEKLIVISMFYDSLLLFISDSFGELKPHRNIYFPGGPLKVTFKQGFEVPGKLI